jgi:hypothetical protein
MGPDPFFFFFPTAYILITAFQQCSQLSTNAAARFSPVPRNLIGDLVRKPSWFFCTTYDIVCDLNLVLVLLVAVAMGTVDHDLGRYTRLRQLRDGRIHVRRAVVGAVLSAPQDDVAVGVSLRAAQSKVKRRRTTRVGCWSYG